MKDVRVEIVDAATLEITEGLRHLIPQLSTSSSAMDQHLLEPVIGTSTNTLLVARHPSSGILGTLTLVVFPIPTGMRAWIEDVVVDEGPRGQGVGEVLVKKAIEIATSMGAKNVDLTSRSDREAANRLYRRLGFEHRSTNVFRLNLQDAPGKPRKAR